MSRRSLNFLACFCASLALIFFLSRIYQVNEEVSGKQIKKTVNSGSREKDTSHSKQIFGNNFELNQDGKQTLEKFPFFQTLNDLTLGFDSKDQMTVFLENAESNGLLVVSKIPALLSARVRVINSGRALAILNGNEKISEIDYNHPVSAPRMVETGRENGFLGSAAEWLGVPEGRFNWGNGVKVAVLDSGVDLSSLHLSSFNLEEISLIPKGSNRADGHGTAVSSIIAGQTKDRLGIAPSAAILSIRVLNDSGMGDSFTVANGIVTAVNKGADLINLSLGGYQDSRVLQNAVNYAHENGVVVVAAAGNDGLNQVSYPARYENVLGVGAVDVNGRSSSFSNHGEGVDLSAPGQEVHAGWEEDEMILFSGTSSATAFVTGALAALLADNSGMTGNDAKNLLLQYANEAEKPGFDKWTGHGTLNLGRVFNRDMPGIYDAALVGYYFAPEDLLSAGQGGTVPFLVSVQNQGTSWINSLKLEVLYKGLKREFLLGNLEPGKTRSEQLYIEGGHGKGGVEIVSKVSIIGESDTNPDNDMRRSRLSFAD